MKKDKSLFPFILNKRRGVCIVGVTFVKWLVLFQLWHYSNTCYCDDQTTKSWLLLERMVSASVFTGQEERLSNRNLTTSSKRKWLNMSPHEPMVRNFRGLGHTPPILTTHTDVSRQLLVRSVRTWRNKDTSWCVCVCLCGHHCEAQGLALQHVLVSGFPTAVETGVQQLDLLPLCARCERECRSTTGHWLVLSCDVMSESAVLSSWCYWQSAENEKWWFYVSWGTQRFWGSGRLTFFLVLVVD